MTGFASRPRRSHAVAIGLAATGLAILVLTAGCTSRAGSPGTGALGAPTGSASAGSPGASLTGTPTTGPATPTPPHTTAPATHAYPDDYAQAILTAWASGDSAYLALLTDAGTAHQIHAFGNINQHWTLIRDDGAAGSIYASFYNNAGDEIILRIVNDAVSQHHWHAGSVQTWDPMTFPTTATAYTTKYVDGWLAGNPARMNLLGTTALTGLFLGLDTPASYTLDPPFSTGAGEVEVEIKDASTSLDISVIIQTATLGHAHAIGGCDIGC